MMQKITIRISKQDFNDEISAILTSHQSGLRLQSTNEQYYDQYDLRQPYRSEIGTWIELAMFVISGIQTSITLAELVRYFRSRANKRTNESQEEEKRGLSVQTQVEHKETKMRPNFFIIINGNEYNLSDLSDEEIKDLLEREKQ